MNYKDKKILASIDTFCKDCGNVQQCFNCISGSNWIEYDGDERFKDYWAVDVGTELKDGAGGIWTVHDIYNKKCKPVAVQLKSNDDGRMVIEHIDELEGYEVRV